MSRYTISSVFSIFNLMFPVSLLLVFVVIFPSYLQAAKIEDPELEYLINLDLAELAKVSVASRRKENLKDVYYPEITTGLINTIPIRGGRAVYGYITLNF